MKQIYTYCFFIFLLLCKIAPAQINFTIKKTDVTCNHLSLGNIEIKVDRTNPPYTYLWSNGQADSSIYALEAGDYSVKITDALAKDTTVTITIYQLECEMEPEPFFTPNGDGYNDTWSISNYIYFPNSLVLVYNRWGQKVYEHSGYYQLPWDGKDLLNVAVPDASYYFIIYKDRKKENELLKGSVSIIR